MIDKIGNMKIGRRLSIGFGIVILITVFVGLFSLLKLQTLAELTENIYEHPLVVSNAVRDIRANINAMHRSMKDVALAETVEKIDTASAAVVMYEQQVYKDFKTVFEQFLGDKRDVDHAYRSFVDWKLIRDEVITLSRRGRKDEAVDITRGK